VANTIQTRKSRLRIGILLNAFIIDNWEYKMLKQIIQDGHSEIVCLVIDGKPSNQKQVTTFEKIKK
jgi:hypothetical protein